MTMPAAPRSRVDFADLAVLLVLAGLVILYAVDSVRASAHVLNLIFVLPVAVLVLTLCLVQFVLELSGRREKPAREVVAAGVPVVMALFSAYVLTLQWLGFDVGTTLFIAAFLWLHGERRMAWLLGYSVSFGLCAASFFSAMLPYPMPMLVLRSALQGLL